MTLHEELRRSEEFDALRAASARLGSDPLQVQGPGGNTSLKRDAAMWIKASGTWLANAGAQDIMVPVNLAALRKAMEAGQTPDDACVVAGLNASGLRASIETSVHAVLDWPVVLHTHCVSTIALAVRADAEAEMQRRLAGIPACFIPYIKPGWDLARSIADRVTPATRIVILGNHGLVACGETVAETEALLRKVSAILTPETVVASTPGTGDLDGPLDGTDWMPAPDKATQAIAHHSTLLNIADGPTLYPDHLVFLGPGVAVARDGETPDAAAERVAGGGPPRKLVLFPGKGAAIPKEATPSLLALARCFGDVLARIAPDAALTRLTLEQEAALLNWDAEKHRQSLNRAEASA